jgi:hypothetical protein
MPWTNFINTANCLGKGGLPSVDWDTFKTGMALRFLYIFLHDPVARTYPGRMPANFFERAPICSLTRNFFLTSNNVALLFET